MAKVYDMKIIDSFYWAKIENVANLFYKHGMLF